MTERALAGLVLAGVSVSLLALPWAAVQGHAGEHCPPSADAAPSTALVAGTPPGCHDAGLGACAAAPGCAGVTPALRPPAPLSVLTAGSTRSAGPSVSHLADLYRVGPPTPPPNS